LPPEETSVGRPKEPILVQSGYSCIPLNLRASVLGSHPRNRGLEIRWCEDARGRPCNSFLVIDRAKPDRLAVLGIESPAFW